MVQVSKRHTTPGVLVDHQRVHQSAALVSIIVAAEVLVAMVVVLQVAVLVQVVLALMHRRPIEALLAAVVVRTLMVQTVVLVQVVE